MYHFNSKLSEKVTSWQLKEEGKRFIAANNLPALSDFLNLSVEKLKQLAEKPNYSQFYTPKPNGEKRLIETPGRELDKLLRKLNYYFQAVYNPIKPDCAYGCIPSTADETSTKNIYTNALQHVGQKWLMNLDIKNFFHSISLAMVQRIFRQEPFACNASAIKLLAKLTTHEMRLPMGASTSPVLANFACLELDSKLEALATQNNWNYTRYIDDMTLSSKKRFKKKHLKVVEDIIFSEGFTVNTDKVEIGLIKDEPMVTGLILKADKPDVSKAYIKNLQQDINIYHQLTSSRILFRNIFPAYILQKFRNSLFGQLNFVKFIRGEGDRTYLKLKNQLMPVLY